MNNALKKAVEVTLLSPPEQEDDSATLGASLNIRQSIVQLLTGRRRCRSAACRYLCERIQKCSGQLCQSDWDTCSELHAARRDVRSYGWQGEET